MKGVPTYFKACVVEAATRKTLAYDPNTGKSIRADYSHPAAHLAIHIDEYLSEQALNQLSAIPKAPHDERGKRLLEFFLKEFPSCMKLIPRRRRDQFLKGIYNVMDQGPFPNFLLIGKKGVLKDL
jgi:hypothetical protein